MNTRYHGTSHLGPMSIDRFVIAEPLPLRRQIEIELEVAANKAMNIPTQENDAAVLDLQEQLVILDAIDFEYIKPVYGQGEDAPLRLQREHILEGLRDPFIGKDEAFALLDELAEIETKLQQM